MTTTKEAVEILQAEIHKAGFVDVGKGAAQHLGMSEARLQTAAQMLVKQGYVVQKKTFAQIVGDKKMTITYLASKEYVERHPAEGFLDFVQENFNDIDRKEYEALKKTTSRMWRNFWIRSAKKQGYSNTEIALEFDLSEGTIRSILKKGEK